MKVKPLPKKEKIRYWSKLLKFGKNSDSHLKEMSPKPVMKTKIDTDKLKKSMSGMISAPASRSASQ
jgi:hypothetical protein|tara:strand:+ start:706 stop:903 length:198 start_codon:yes stop_codon:yes gene_type:complete